MEEQNQKRFLAVSYRLYDAAQPETLIEEAPADHPFVFISGFGVALEAFEKKIVELQEGEAFDFTLRQEEAYGPFMSERVVDLDREIFCINGHFDHDNVKVDAVDALELSRQAGSTKAANIVLMGRLSHYFDLPEEAWQQSLQAMVPPKFLELNRKAFELGRNA